MAHELEIRNGRASMAFVGDVPWHGLGHRIDGIPTVEEMRVAAGLDWEVSAQSIFVAGRRKVPGYQAIMRDLDGAVLSITSDKYHPVEVGQVFDFFRQYADAGEMTLETAGSLQGGKVIWCLAKLGDSFEVHPNDRHEMYLLMSNGYDPGFAMQLDLTNVRVVCMNTMRMARAGKMSDTRVRWTHKHNVKFDKVREAEARAVVENARKTNKAQAELMQRLAATKADSKVMESYVVELLQPELIEAAREAGRLGHKFESNSDILAAALEMPVGSEHSRKVDESKDAGKWLLEAIMEANDPVFDQKDFQKATRDILHAIDRQPGAAFGRDTMYQAFNAVTYNVDHKWGRTPDTRIQNAWYGERASLKESALDLALAYTERLGVAA